MGLGIVRSLDVAAGLIYLLTPLPEAELQQVNVLQVGSAVGDAAFQRLIRITCAGS